ncbi:MAG: hypothetical protein ABSG59_17350 [Verrucomicrobiota bacterium]
MNSRPSEPHSNTHTYEIQWSPGCPFRVFLAEGRYTVRYDGKERIETFLPTGAYQLDLRPGLALDFELSNIPGKDGKLRISLSARGEGVHSFSIRGNNFNLADKPAGSWMPKRVSSPAGMPLRFDPNPGEQRPRRQGIVPPVLMRGGLASLVTSYTSLAEDLGSHGYVVVGYPLETLSTTQRSARAVR